MTWAANHIYHKYLTYDTVEIYEYQTRTLHSKTLTCDGIYSMIGSFNFDWLSSLQLCEINTAIVSTGIATELEKQFDIDVKNSKQITKEQLKERGVLLKAFHWLSYFLVKLTMGTK